MTASIPQSLQGVRARIAALEQRYRRESGSVHLLAVSKTKPPAAVRAAYDAGQRDFGENHLQDALRKIDALAELDIAWHFIGPVQSNKTRTVAERFTWVHSIDRLKIAHRLSAQRPDTLPPLNVCIQVNVSAETSKAGLDPDTVLRVAEEISGLPRLKLRGLMALPRPEEELERQRGPFRQLRLQLAALRAHGFELDTLSMGMTNDLEAAIAEGATIVRVGTAIFGQRPVK